MSGALEERCMRLISIKYRTALPKRRGTSVKPSVQWRRELLRLAPRLSAAVHDDLTLITCGNFLLRSICHRPLRLARGADFSRAQGKIKKKFRLRRWPRRFTLGGPGACCFFRTGTARSAGPPETTWARFTPSPRLCPTSSGRQTGYERAPPADHLLQAGCRLV